VAVRDKCITIRILTITLEIIGDFFVFKFIIGIAQVRCECSVDRAIFFNHIT